MKFLTIFLLITTVLLTPACGQFNLSDDTKNGRKGGNDEDFELDRINEKEIRDALTSMSNCTEYTHGQNTFRIFNIFGAAMEQLENCISKALDKSIGTICIEEKRLNKLEKKHKNDDDALSQIDDYRDQLEYLKEDIADQLYSIADIFDELDIKLKEKVDENVDLDHILGPLAESFWYLVIESEVGGFRKFFEIRANRLCGYDVLSRSNEGGNRRDN